MGKGATVRPVAIKAVDVGLIHVLPTTAPRMVEKKAQQSLDFMDVVVNEGMFSGLVLNVAGGIVTQKINRDGRTALHDVQTLSRPVVAGDVVEITYAKGLGIVGGKDVSLAGMER